MAEIALGAVIGAVASAFTLLVICGLLAERRDRKDETATDLVTSVRRAMAEGKFDAEIARALIRNARRKS